MGNIFSKCCYKYEELRDEPGRFMCCKECNGLFLIENGTRCHENGFCNIRCYLQYCRKNVIVAKRF